jgi:hypothetical protein
MASFPTLSVYNQLKSLGAVEILNDDFDRLKKSYDRDIPLYENAVESWRILLRDKVNTRTVGLYNIRCDHCGIRLVNPEILKVVISSVPKYHIACPGCGWSGYHVR